MTGVAYTKAALRGLGMDSYTSAALRGFGDETYTNAALRGFGDETYTNAALRGMGKFKKGSPEAKAFMARLRAMRATKSKGGKKLKGGIAFSTVAAALGLIPTAIKGAHAIYKWIKGSGMLKSKTGGRALILDPKKRDEYIDVIKSIPIARRRAAVWPYKLDKARAHAEKRERRLGKDVVDYLKANDLYDAAIFDTASMKHYGKEARAALLQRHKRTDEGIVLPELIPDEPVPISSAPALSSRRRPKSNSAPAPKYNLRSRGLANRGLPNGKI